MYAETKRRTYFQMGIFLVGIGFLLSLIGVYYVNGLSYVGSTVYGLATQRAATLWGGILLVCLALRNVTLGHPNNRFATDSMWDTFSAIFTNLLAFLISGAVVGVTLWAHIDFLRNVDISTLEGSTELVNLIAILLLGTLGMLTTIVGCIVACFPISDGQAPPAGEQYAMDNQGFNKH
ncbi:uncharacterized protein LOC121417318 isoform X1 [Lytechinus variegatus]|uniref:uncharacterized protein LOC121417266 isoform X1 n=2 Tax=Lytechinus variegatus TaxID=7654 RepID=UPI001BB1C637|nr:uncharacterized protein LOC121417266 isoform X1 [Lytechinus variegatus]XP_041466911.1 uncharacterized protein LOC121417318 isoform X1 [Lytechinus variegatus]